MKKIKFTKGAVTIYMTGPDPLKAMQDANRALPLGAGAWFEDGPDAYRWVEGNFFD